MILREAQRSSIASLTGADDGAVPLNELRLRVALEPRDLRLVATVNGLIANGQADHGLGHLKRTTDGVVTQGKAGKVISPFAHHAGSPKAFSATSIARGVRRGRQPSQVAELDGRELAGAGERRGVRRLEGEPRGRTWRWRMPRSRLRRWARPPAPSRRGPSLARRPPGRGGDAGLRRGRRAHQAPRAAARRGARARRALRGQPAPPRGGARPAPRPRSCADGPHRTGAGAGGLPRRGLPDHGAGAALDAGGRDGGHHLPRARRRDAPGGPPPRRAGQPCRVGRRGGGLPGRAPDRPAGCRACGLGG